MSQVADAFCESVLGAAGGVEGLAARLGMNAQVLRNKANPNISTNIPSLSDVDRVMALTADYRVLHALASTHGHVCVQVDESTTSSDLAVLELVTQVWQANGDVGKAVNDTLADGRVEPHEIANVRQAIYRTQKALFEMLTRLEGMAEK